LQKSSICSTLHYADWLKAIWPLVFFDITKTKILILLSLRNK
jgi:hypothetical protein